MWYTSLGKQFFLYSVPVRPHLDIVSVWGPHFKEDVNKMERIQRKPTKVIRGLENTIYKEKLKNTQNYLG